MIDFSKIEQYRENNRIEAKKLLAVCPRASGRPTLPLPTLTVVLFCWVQRNGRITPVHQVLREALANCLVNADYYGRQGLVIVKKRDSITMTNPGGFRIEIDAARSGGVSDPRNGLC